MPSKLHEELVSLIVAETGAKTKKFAKELFRALVSTQERPPADCEDAVTNEEWNNFLDEECNIVSRIVPDAFSIDIDKQTVYVWEADVTCKSDRSVLKYERLWQDLDDRSWSLVLTLVDQFGVSRIFNDDKLCDIFMKRFYDRCRERRSAAA